MSNVDLRELGKFDCYEQLLDAYLELYFNTYEGKRVIELYDSDYCGLLDPSFNGVYREIIYKVIKMFNYEAVDNFVKKKHEEYERKCIEEQCKEGGETND